MKLSLLFIGSFIACVTIIMQFWMSGIVFHYSYMCRTKFDNSDVSVVNKMACINSLNDTMLWNCTCQYFNAWYGKGGVEVDVWMKVFDDGSVALASLVFIFLIFAEVPRICSMVAKIYGIEIWYLTTYDYFSVFGILALVLDPSICNKNISSTYGETLVIIIDILAIILVFQYTNALNTSISYPVFLLTLITSSCDAFRCLCTL